VSPKTKVVAQLHGLDITYKNCTRKIMQDVEFYFNGKKVDYVVNNSDELEYDMFIDKRLLNKGVHQELTIKQIIYGIRLTMGILIIKTKYWLLIGLELKR